MLSPPDIISRTHPHTKINRAVVPEKIRKALATFKKTVGRQLNVATSLTTQLFQGNPPIQISVTKKKDKKARGTALKNFRKLQV